MCIKKRNVHRRKNVMYITYIFFRLYYYKTNIQDNKFHTFAYMLCYSFFLGTFRETHGS